MAQYYRNDNLYSNTSESSRNGGGSWVYINGELYHYGRPGMEWGKHLPGTEWWKEKTGKISNLYQTTRGKYLENTARGLYGSNKTVNNLTKAKATVNALGKTAKYVGQGLAKYAKRLPGHVVKETKNIALNAREDMKEAYQKSYAKSVNIIADYIEKMAQIKPGSFSADSPLYEAVKKQGRDMAAAWGDSKEKTIMNYINTAIQATQYNIVSGINKYMVENNTMGTVDSFLKKLGIRK